MSNPPHPRDVANPGHRINVLARLITSHGYTSYTEVGVKQGKTFVSVLRKTGAVGVAVDAWEPIPNERETYEDWDFNQIKLDYDENIKGLNVMTLHMTSLEAAKVAPDTDLVFIDAAHDYQNLVLDIKAWRPKCKIISGHDYGDKFPGVIKAVDELVPGRKVETDKVWWDYA